MFKSRLIVDNVYQRQTLFICCKTKQEYAKAFYYAFREQLQDENDIISCDDFFESESNIGRTIFERNVCIIIIKGEQTKFEYIAHEIFHAVEYHFEKIGLPHSESSSEAWAYYIQFLTKEILENLN